MAKSQSFGWEVDVATLEGMVKEGKRTFHYRGCRRSAAMTKALLRRTDQSGQHITVKRVIEIRPVSEEEWIRAYGIGRM